MILDRLIAEEGAACAAADAMHLIEAMYPICRSITGNGVRRTLDLVETWIPLVRTEVPTGTQLFDWEVPREWNVRDAYIADGDGRRVVDFRAHNLHLMSYSVPVDATMSLAELEPHLYTLPEHPDWIPYRTTYYRDHWGFCLRHCDRLRLKTGSYRVVIDTALTDGHLTYAECCVPGQTAAEAIIYTHVCHPSLANDNLTGIAVAAALARELRRQQPRLTWRFVFGPGTIGSLAWLSRNEARLPQLHCGLVIGLLGDAGSFTYKRSRRGSTVTDRAAEYVLRSGCHAATVQDFVPYGYDERQFCSPGFDLPVGRLTRSANGAYAEYHSSADNLDLIREDKLAESVRILARMLAILDTNRRPLGLCPKGEPRLGKRGLYGSVGGGAPRPSENAMLWVLNQADGRHDLLHIADRSSLTFEDLARAADDLQRAGLLADSSGEAHPVRNFVQ